MHQNYDLSKAYIPSVKAFHDAVTYNASAFMAAASTLDERLLIVTDASYLGSEKFKAELAEIQQLIDERTRKVLNGEYPRPPRPERPAALPRPQR